MYSKFPSLYAAAFSVFPGPGLLISPTGGFAPPHCRSFLLGPCHLLAKATLLSHYNPRGTGWPYNEGFHISPVSSPAGGMTDHSPLFTKHLASHSKMSIGFSWQLYSLISCKEKSPLGFVCLFVWCRAELFILCSSGHPTTKCQYTPHSSLACSLFFLVSGLSQSCLLPIGTHSRLCHGS